MGQRSRRSELDGLRGLAVLLMLGQHLMVWLWDHAADSPFALPLTAISAAGGMGAPLFITLAGCASALGERANDPRPQRSLVRGLALLGMAYLLSLLTPSWFSLRSFYVLHLLGIGLIIAPWCLRRSKLELGILALLVAPLSAGFQAYFALPLSMGNKFMSARPLSPELGQALSDAAIRALVAGHFPLLPWLLAFFLGILAGKILREQGQLPLRYGLLPLITGATGLGLGLSGLIEASRQNWLYRLVSPQVPFFPCSFALCLALGGLALCLITLAGKAPARLAPLVPLGRISLTVLMLHLPLFRELTRPVDMWRNLDGATTLVVMLVTMIACIWISHRWRRIDYRYGAEWLLRRADRFAPLREAPTPHE